MTSSIFKFSILTLICFFSLVESRTSQCGRVGGIANARIRGGVVPINDNAWPWIVTINTSPFSFEPTNSWNIAHSCGGSIVHQQWVITAAHCLDDKNQRFPEKPPSHWTVTAGVFSRHVTQASVLRWQSKKVIRFLVHENYKNENGAQHHDIALIQLKSPLVFNDHVRPICLPYGRTTQPKIQSKCKTAGWGVSSENSRVFSLRLQEVQIPIINYRTCQLVYKNAVKPHEHLCGWDVYYGALDACKGDSGGPLACELSDGSWYLAGIVSWGVGCGRKHAPGIYTNVKTYEEWILRRIIFYTETT